jgi:hypothetical protein
MRPALVQLAALPLALAACSPSARDASPAPVATRTAPPEGQLTLKEFMPHVMERNAEQLWAWTAFINDEHGPHYTKPETDKDWVNAESDGLTMVQISYLLDSPGLAVDDPRWAPHVADFRAAVQASAKAAEAKDFGAMEQSAEKIDRACVACHRTFVPQIELPDPPEASATTS